MSQPIVLGLSASLRNFRHGAGRTGLTDELAKLPNRDALVDYLRQQNQGYRGRTDKDGSGTRARKAGVGTGLSNSEAALAAGLWGAMETGAQCRHIALHEYLPGGGERHELESLKQALREADAIILSTPTYFGDRSSIVMRFIEMLRRDRDLARDMAGKVYAGIAVGAKRNGGQETTLIYQMLDLINLGMLGVGNDSTTTSQYGGTGHAGDIGTMAEDAYGLNTCFGTGYRIGRVAAILAAANDFQLTDEIRVGVWELQDRNREMSALLDGLLTDVGPGAQFHRRPFDDLHILPCNACDICPSRIGPDGEYRCFIKTDDMRSLHPEIIASDVLMPVLYSPQDRNGLVSRYQEFMERTRYLRRGDYVLSDRLVVPVVFEEAGARENLHIRMLTSLIRHHTVMHRPVIGWLHEGRLLNREQVVDDLKAAMAAGRRLTTGRLGMYSIDSRVVQYNPVGYVLSNLNEDEKKSIEARQMASQERKERLIVESGQRLETNNTRKNKGGMA